MTLCEVLVRPLIQYCASNYSKNIDCEERIRGLATRKKAWQQRNIYVQRLSPYWVESKQNRGGLAQTFEIVEGPTMCGIEIVLCLIPFVVQREAAPRYSGVKLG